MPPRRSLVSFALGCLAACGDATPDEHDAASTSQADPTTTTGDAATTDVAATTGDPAPTACSAPTTVTAAPRTIAGALAFIEQLPRPLDLDCVLERLERPLVVAATSSLFSLQPAVGPRSPRLLILGDGLILSVAVAGDGFDLLEFGEYTDAARTIKAEIEFPVVGPVEPAAPFTRILDADLPGTKCGVCHRDEAPAPAYPQAFASGALRFPDIDEVPLADVRAEYETCDPAVDAARCARLAAVFAHGPVTQGRLPGDLPTIYD